MRHRIRALSLVRRRLESESVSWDSLANQSEQIILFGSSTLIFKGDPSDLDLLCVGEGHRIKTRTLDVLWKTKAEVSEKRWLGSELANHIASYGIWLLGEDTWSDQAYVSDYSKTYKRAVVFSRYKSLCLHGKSLSNGYLEKHVRKLRRDIQRLALLEMGKAVPPNPILDRLWRSADRPRLGAIIKCAKLDCLFPIDALDQFADLLFPVRRDTGTR